jgi:HSP20 family protein
MENSMKGTCSNIGECCDAVLMPFADIIDGPEAMTVTVDLPGVSQDKVEVVVERGVLSISARRDISSDGITGSFHKEFDTGTFKRSFKLPKGVDAERIGAQFRDGVLTFTIPHAEQAQAKRVEIRGAH